MLYLLILIVNHTVFDIRRRKAPYTLPKNTMTKEDRVILTGEENHAQWKRFIEAAIKGKGLWRHIEGRSKRPKDAVRPTTAATTSTAAPVKLMSDDEWDIVDEAQGKLQDQWDMDHNTCILIILKHIDNTHRISVTMLKDPQEIWEKLNFRYEGENATRVFNIIEKIFGVIRLTASTVDEKVDMLQTLNESLGLLRPEFMQHDGMLGAILMISMSEDFSVEVALLKSKGDPQSLSAIATRFRERETLLNNDIHPDTVYAARGGGNGRNDGAGGRYRGRGGDDRQRIRGDGNGNLRRLDDDVYCNSCNKQAKDLPQNHRHDNCHLFLETPAGKRYATSERGKAFIARFGIDGKKSGKNVVRSARVAFKESKIDNNAGSSDSSDSDCTIDSFHMYPKCPRESANSTHPNICDGWGLDTMASRHISNRQHAFVPGSMRPSKVVLSCANGGVMTAAGEGDVRILVLIENNRKQYIVFKDVLYVPAASENLISLGQVQEKVNAEYTVDGHGNLRMFLGNITYFCGTRRHRTYRLTQPATRLKTHSIDREPVKVLSSTEAVTYAISRTKNQLLHARLGHPGKTRSARYKHLVRGLGKKNCEPCQCEACIMSKIKRRPTRVPMTKSDTPLSRIHADLCGPFPVPSLMGKRYMLTMTCEATRFTETTYHTTKNEIVTEIKAFKVRAELFYQRKGDNYKLQRIHIDRGREFFNKAMQTWCDEHHIKLEATVGYNPEANGIAERINRTLLETADALRVEAGLPEPYWEFSCKASTYLHNRGPVSTLPDTTPWEEKYGEAPDVSHYRVWGCTAYVHIPKEKRKKLSRKAWKGIFVGYKWDSPGIWLIWNPTTKMLHEARFIIFDERCRYEGEDRPSKRYKKAAKKLAATHGYGMEDFGGLDDETSSGSGSDSEGDDDDLMVPSRIPTHTQIKPAEGFNLVNTIPNNTPREPSESGGAPHIELTPAPAQHVEPTPKAVPATVATPSERPSAVAPSSHTSKTKQLDLHRVQRKKDKEAATASKQEERRLAEIERGDRRSGRVRDRAMAIKERLLRTPRISTLPAFHTRIPLSLTTALLGPDADNWMQAWNSEVQSIKQLGTFSAPIQRPMDVKDSDLVTIKEVFDIKHDGRFKVRFVARGFKQRHLINYDETYAPTMAYDTLRLLLAIACKNGWPIRQVDVVTAFLNGTLADRVIFRLTGRLKDIFGEFVQGLKAIYGLKQAARVWYLLLTEFLCSLGFEPFPTDPTLMISKDKKLILAIGIYVDDLLLTGESLVEINRIIKALEGKFKVKDLGLAHHVLGMRILRKDNLLSLDQARYAADVVEQFYYPSSPIYSTPMDENTLRILESEDGELLDDDDLTKFLSLLGKLNWLCHTRAEIVFAVHRVQQYSAKARKLHWKALLRILGYIAGTLEYGIVWGNTPTKAEGIEEINYYSVDHNIEVHAGSSKANELATFSDADYAADKTTSKSVSGLLTIINGAVVSCASTKQKGVSKGTTEAEYIAMSDAAKRALWARMILAFLEGHPIEWDDDGDSHSELPAALLFGDNKAAVILSQGLKNTSSIRHIRTSYHHILDEVKHGSIKTYWVPGKDMLADGFTKPLPRGSFEEKRGRIGIHNVAKMMEIKGIT